MITVVTTYHCDHTGCTNSMVGDADAVSAAGWTYATTSCKVNEAPAEMLLHCPAHS